MYNEMDLKDNRSEKVHYSFSEYPIYISRDLLSTYPNYTASNHWHDDVEFITVLSGKMKYHVNGEIISLRSGEGIFVNARQMHFGFSDNYSECDFLCVLLHPILLCASASTERDYVIPLIRNQNMPYIKITNNKQWHRTVFDGIYEIYQNKDSMTAPVKIQSLFLSVWTELFSNTPPPRDKKVVPNNNLTILKNMVGCIQQNYSKKLSLADIARSGAVGESKCCKLFREYFNQTPGNYLTIYRLNKSIELLRDSHMTVSEIALEVGFGGASYYAETFRKWVGKSPRKYKKFMQISSEQRN